jgi:hypothetical protein
MTGLSDSIWKVGFQTKIKATFGKYWSSGFGKLTPGSKYHMTADAF